MPVNTHSSPSISHIAGVGVVSLCVWVIGILLFRASQHPQLTLYLTHRWCWCCLPVCVIGILLFRASQHPQLTLYLTHHWCWCCLPVCVGDRNPVVPCQSTPTAHPLSHTSLVLVLSPCVCVGGRNPVVPCQSTPTAHPLSHTSLVLVLSPCVCG